jgi:acetoin utilization protein AcuB
MRVSSWMSPDPVSTAPGVAAAEAGRIMHNYGIRHLPVVLHERVVGMISDRDIRGAMPGRTVADIMSSPAHVVDADDTIETAARLMLSRHISALPVVDISGHLIGMITTTDCLLASLTPVDTPAV